MQGINHLMRAQRGKSCFSALQNFRLLLPHYLTYYPINTFPHVVELKKYPRLLFVSFLLI